MKKKPLMLMISILLITMIGLPAAAAYIAEQPSKNAYKKLDYSLNISCFSQVKESICTLPKPQSYNLNTRKYQEEYHDFYELSQDIF